MSSGFRKFWSLLSARSTAKTLLTLSDQGVASVTNFLTSIMIGRYCSKSEFALYSLGFSITLFIITIQESLIAGPYTVYRPRLTGLAAKHYNGSVLMHQAALCLTAVTGIMIASLIASYYSASTDLAWALQGLAIAIAPILFRDYFRRINFANLLVGVTFAMDLWVAVIQLGGLFFFCYLGILNIMHAYWIIAASCALVSIYWLISNREALSVSIEITRHHLLQNLTFGRWVVAANLVSLMSSQLYLWFLTLSRGTADVSALAACQGVIVFSNPLLIGLKNSMGPKMSHVYAKQGTVGLRRTVFQVSALLGLLMGLFCLVLIPFGDRLVAGLYGSKYAGFGLVVSVLALGTWVSAASWPSAYGLWTLDRVYWNFKVDLVGAGISLTLGLLLVKLFGVSGAAFGYLISSIVTSCIRWRLFHRFIKTC